ERIRVAAEAQTAAAQSVVADRRARLDAATVAVPNARNVLAAAEATLANQTARANRLASLSGKGFVPAQEVDNARTLVEVQRATVEVARGQLAAAEETRRSAAALLAASEKEAVATAERGRAEVESARANVGQTGAAMGLANANSARIPAYRARIGALEAALAAAGGDLRNLKALKATTTLRSPIDGVVVERLLDNGALCTSAQVIAVVEALGTVRVRVEVPEEVVSRLKVGDLAEVSADSVPGTRFAGRIAEINAAVDARTHQCRVRVEVDNAGRALRSGVFARATFETARRSGAVVVPPEALRREGDRTVVAVVGKDEVVALVDVVETGRDDRGVAVDGLPAGARVVVLSAAPVRDGAKVKVSAGEDPKSTGGRGSVGGSKP
ncbi:MAG: efflux RND transporter periplasmic adaptor subunit, partial [Armatimonadota bacterium]